MIHVPASAGRPECFRAIVGVFPNPTSYQASNDNLQLPIIPALQDQSSSHCKEARALEGLWYQPRTICEKNSRMSSMLLRHIGHRYQNCRDSARRMYSCTTTMTNGTREGPIPVKRVDSTTAATAQSGIFVATNPKRHVHICQGISCRAVLQKLSKTTEKK